MYGSVLLSITQGEGPSHVKNDDDDDDDNNYDDQDTTYTQYTATTIGYRFLQLFKVKEVS